MPMTENEKDVQLLRNDFGGLIVKYQATVRIIVGKFVASGLFRQSETEDIVQAVNDSLLQKIPQIRSQYTGSTLIRTYLSSIIRNVCLKEFHARKRAPPNIPLDEAGIGRPDGPFDRALIREEITRFRDILRMYHGEVPKLLVCLKLYFRLPITRHDVLDWYPRCSKRDHEFLLESFGGNYDDLLETDVFRLFSTVINKAEGKRNRPHAIQRWTNKRVNEILELLNGDSPASAHNRETLKILFENYVRPFLRT
jgi:DNA-directed RNA polymerase specialized sigma24 family protein